MSSRVKIEEGIFVNIAGINEEEKKEEEDEKEEKKKYSEEPTYKKNIISIQHYLYQTLRPLDPTYNDKFNTIRFMLNNCGLWFCMVLVYRTCEVGSNRFKILRNHIVKIMITSLMCNSLSGIYVQNLAQLQHMIHRISKTHLRNLINKLDRVYDDKTSFDIMNIKKLGISWLNEQRKYLISGMFNLLAASTCMTVMTYGVLKNSQKLRIWAIIGIYPIILLDYYVYKMGIKDYELCELFCNKLCIFMDINNIKPQIIPYMNFSDLDKYIIIDK